jgi:transcription termination factor Rho
MSSDPRFAGVLEEPSRRSPAPHFAMPNEPATRGEASLPAEGNLTELHSAPLATLMGLARQLDLRLPPLRGRQQLTIDIVRAWLARGVPVAVDGILEIGADSLALLRSAEFSFAPSPADIFVPPAIVRQFGLKPGNRVAGALRAARDKEKFTALDQVTSIEGIPVAKWAAPKAFDLLTPLFPTQRIILESPHYPVPTVRAVDLIATLGRGQRGLILAPPRTGKTILLKHIAKAIRKSSPEISLMLLLVDERPEEVTDFKAEIDADVFSSTFDEPATRHIQVAELVCERAKRLVELGRHVVVLLDSITRLARSYNSLQSGKGRLMSGGLEAKALIKPKRFFSAARNTEEGGSLTILATALVDTGSRADEVIFEEFKGTGNMELHLDRELVDKRIYPAIHIMKSGTRREELLYHPDELQRVQLLRKQLAALPPLEGMEVLLENILATKTNTELLLTGLRS